MRRRSDRPDPPDPADKPTSKTPATSEPPASRSGGILTETAFLRLWIAQSIPGLGDGILLYLQALLALEKAQQTLLEGEHQALGVASLSLMLAAPLVGTAPAILLGGVLADRLPRRRLLIGAQLLSTAALIPLVLAPHPSPVLVAGVFFLISASGALQGPASLTWQTQLIRREENLQKANSLRALTTSGMALLAPASGGLLVATGGTRAATWTVMLIYVLGAVALLAVPSPPRQPPSVRPRPLRELGAGFVALRGCRWARLLLIWGLVVNFLLGPGNLMGNVVLASRFGDHLVPMTATLQTAATVGSLAGTALLLRWSPRRPGRALLLMGVLEAGDALLWVWCPISWPLVASAGLTAAGAAIYPLLWLTALQRHFPNQVLGRVLAAFQSSILVSVSLGLAVAVPVAALVSPTTVLVVSAGILVASVVLVLRVPGVADLRDPPRPAAPSPSV